jgi:hypothetical protein
MLSYPIDEAEVLLTTKLSAAKQSLANCEEDLDFLREQITVRLPPRPFNTPWLALGLTGTQTMEVATARVYNWDVTMKRKEKNEQGALEESGKDGTPNG